MNKLKFILKAGLFCTALCLSGQWAMADGPEGSDEPDGSDVPIDGGVSLLVGAAVLYGAKKVRDKKKADQDEQLNEK